MTRGGFGFDLGSFRGMPRPRTEAPRRHEKSVSVGAKLPRAIVGTSAHFEKLPWSVP
jgi:hypothetical protein